MSSLSDIHERADVVRFVDAFYGKVQNDELIGPVFASRISNWKPHLNKMYDFWSSILLGTGKYRGQPFPKHLGLGIEQMHFDRWLSLFEENMLDLYEGPMAEMAISRAKSIAEIFAYKIEMLEDKS